MMLSADQLLVHVIGDYVLQSSYTANNKVSKPGRRLFTAAMCALHVTLYALAFWWAFHPSLAALAVIAGTHFLIDHFRLAAIVCWAKNLLDPDRSSWAEAKTNFGFSKGTPAHISFWIMVLVDNTMHIVINALALAFL